MNIKELNDAARAAYQAAGFTGKGARVYVVGTGVRPVGPLKNVVAFTPNSLTDDGDHETYVASVIRRWLPDAVIISVRVEDNARGNPTEPIVAGLEAVAQAIKADRSGAFSIVNMSLTSMLNPADPLAARYNAAVDMITAAGGVVMASAGNTDALETSLYPACIYDVWTAAGLTEDGRRDPQSSASEMIDFSDEYSVYVLNLTTLGYHTVMSGTSFTIPILTSKRVLIGEVFRSVKGRWPTDDEAYEIAKALAADLGANGRDPDTGWGVVSMQTPAVIKALITKEGTPVNTVRPTLRKGSTGAYVKQAQALLNEHGAALAVDGDFGAKTLAAVTAFQASHGLVADGIIGPKTWAALDMMPSTTPVMPTPTTVRERVIAAALDAAASLIGTDYSQDRRDNIYPGGSFDCSSFVAAVYAAAGFPLLKVGAELRNSTSEVDAAGFDLIYPSTRSTIGKNLPSKAGLLSTYGAREGDLVFFGLKDTPRANKITHVAMVDKDALNLIQTANNREKCCRVPLNKYDKCVCAIIRLREDVALPSLFDITRGDKRAYLVRMLQIALNLRYGERLVCDGDYGSKTAAAVARVNAGLGMPSDVCTDKTWAALGFVNNG